MQDINVNDLESIFGNMSNFNKDEQNDFNLALFNKSSKLDLKNIQNNINILDEDINESDNDLESPAAILNKYTDLENEINEIKANLEKYKDLYSNIFSEALMMENKISDLKSKQNDLKPKLTDSMKNAGLKNLKNSKFKVVYIAATLRENFNKDKFKKKYPVLYKEFTTTSEVSDYIRISEVK